MYVEQHVCIQNSAVCGKENEKNVSQQTTIRSSGCGSRALRQLVQVGQSTSSTS